SPTVDRATRRTRDRPPRRVRALRSRTRPPAHPATRRKRHPAAPPSSYFVLRTSSFRRCFPRPSSLPVGAILCVTRAGEDRRYAGRMRQLAAAITMVLTVAGADARAQRAAAPEPDHIGAALATLETGLASTDRDELRAALDLAPWMVDWLETNVPPRAGTFVAITERSRSAAHVLAEVFVAAGARGMLATWQMAVIPAET